MAKYKITAPDGSNYEVEAPDTATEQEVLAYAQSNFGPTQKQAKLESAPQTKQKPPSGFLRGLRDPIDAGAQLLSKITPAPVENAVNQLNNYLAQYGIVAPVPAGGVDQMIRESEAKYQGQRTAAGETGIDWGRLAGNVVNPANLAFASKVPQAASLAGRVGLGALSGGMMGMAQPVTQGDFATEKAKQAAGGAIAGGVLPMLTGAAARVVKPQPRPQLQTLAKEGVPTTLGQNLGGGFRKAEEAAKSIPFVGDLVAASERRGIEGLNRAAINRSLAPIGQKLPKNVEVGNKAISYAGDKVSQYYDDVLTKVSGTLDDQFKADLDNLRGLAESMPDAQKSQFNRIIDNEIIKRFTDQGKASGETIKNIESKLGQMAKGYRRSDDYDKRVLGDAILETQNALREMLQRVNPQHAKELTKANTAYANLLRAETAASRIGAKEGVFSPAQFRSSVRSLDPSKNKRSFARGNALMQDLADAADDTLANKLPDSGTAYRSIWNPTTLLGSAVGLPASIPAALMYNPLTEKALQTALTQRPEVAGQVAQLIRQSSPYLNPAAVPAGYGLLNMLQQQ